MPKFKPSYFGISDAEETMTEFLTDAVKQFLNDQLEDIDTGWKYVNDYKGKVKYAEAKKSIDAYGSDALIALVTVAEEENLNEQKILDLLLKSMYVESTNSKQQENTLFSVPLPDEIPVDEKEYINIPGKLNGKDTPNMYESLCDMIDDDYKISNAQEKVKYLDIDESGYATIQIVQPTYWVAFVDEDKFQTLLLSELEMSEQELQTITKEAVNK